jgi:hypothetical protein
VGSASYYMPKLLEETLATKFIVIAGYQGGADTDLAVEKGEIHCRSLTIQTYFSREPYGTWRKKGFVRVLMQTGKTRDPRLADVPTLYELMNEHKTPEGPRRLVALALAATEFGRPIIAPPGVPPDRTKTLREAFMKAMSDPELLAEAKRKNFDITPTGGEELQTLAQEVVAQPPDVLEQVKKLLGQ